MLKLMELKILRKTSRMGKLIRKQNGLTELDIFLLERLSSQQGKVAELTEDFKDLFKDLKEQQQRKPDEH